MTTSTRQDAPLIPTGEPLRTRILCEFLRAPTTIGAIAASGPRLALAATAPVPAGADVVVVELGPGTGAMTKPVTDRLAGHGRQLAVEVNDRLASGLAARHPAVEVVRADAAELGTVLADRGIDHTDVVISSLPWAAFPAAQQVDVLDEIVEALPPQGAFTTFAYLHSRWTPAARHFRRQLDLRFEEVLVGRTVWWNLPPALVYYARRPTSPQARRCSSRSQGAPRREPVPPGSQAAPRREPIGASGGAARSRTDWCRRRPSELR